MLSYVHTSYITSENLLSILTFSNSRKNTFTPPHTHTSLAHPSLPLSNWLEIQIHFYRNHPPHAGNGKTKPGTGGVAKRCAPPPNPSSHKVHTHTHNQPTEQMPLGLGVVVVGGCSAIKTAAYARPVVLRRPPSLKNTGKKPRRALTGSQTAALTFRVNSSISLVSHSRAKNWEEWAWHWREGGQDGSWLICSESTEIRKIK